LGHFYLLQARRPSWVLHLSHLSSNQLYLPVLYHHQLPPLSFAKPLRLLLMQVFITLLLLLPKRGVQAE
jgi:hypothetical protein